MDRIINVNVECQNPDCEGAQQGGHKYITSPANVELGDHKCPECGEFMVVTGEVEER